MRRPRWSGNLERGVELTISADEADRLPRPDADNGLLHRAYQLDS